MPTVDFGNNRKEDDDENDDEEIVAALCDIDDGLSPWEIEFAESVSSYVESGGLLSEKQRAIIVKILDRMGA